MIGTHIGNHWNTLGLNFCPLMPFMVTPWPDEVPTLRCQGRAGCRPCWIQRPMSRTREKWGSKRISDMVDKEYQRMTQSPYPDGFHMVSCHEYWWIRFSIGTKPHIVLILSVAWQICVQRASMRLITYPQISTVFFVLWHFCKTLEEDEKWRQNL